MKPENSARPDEDVKSAWREGLAEASRHPAFKQQLLQREGELLPRFAEHYAKLKHLPRRVRRSLQRHWKRSLAGVALLLALGANTVSAATINVGGVCTLIRAINAANNDTTATGHCKKGSGADRIVMPRNSTVSLTAVNDTTFGPTGLPTIRGVVTIDGNGSTVKRGSGASNFRIFAVSDSGDLTLRNTTVTGGVAITVPGITYSGSGGGLYTYCGATTLIGVSVTGNRANKAGGGVAGTGGLECNGASLALINSTVSGNKAGGEGGGVASSYYGGASLTNSTVSSNTAGSFGGGVANRYASISVTNSTISGNTAANGGGLSNEIVALAHITNSTISGNKANADGGGVDSSSAKSQLFITHSTVSGNSAGASGGGVFGDGELKRTLVSGNTAKHGRELYAGDYGIYAANFNVLGHSAETNAQAFINVTPGTTDITATSNGNRPTALNRILNTTLANNGGRTRTHALVAGSPAVDAVNDGTCPPPARDQRGVRRPRDGNGDGGLACDVGSFER